MNAGLLQNVADIGTRVSQEARRRELSGERAIGFADSVQRYDRCRRRQRKHRDDSILYIGLRERRASNYGKTWTRGEAAGGAHECYRCVALREYFRYDMLACPSTGTKEEEMHCLRREGPPSALVLGLVGRQRALR